jgi:putative sterol carrier protein
LRRQVDTSAAPEATIQWNFTDAEPWHLEIHDGVATAATGRVEHPDLVFRCRFQDWLDLTAGRAEPWRSALTGKVRVRGNLRMLLRAPKLFA